MFEISESFDDIYEQHYHDILSDISQQSGLYVLGFKIKFSQSERCLDRALCRSGFALVRRLCDRARDLGPHNCCRVIDVAGSLTIVEAEGRGGGGDESGGISISEIKSSLDEAFPDSMAAGLSVIIELGM